MCFEKNRTFPVDANPFLQKVQRQLSSRLQRMPERYSVTSVLDAWVGTMARLSYFNQNVEMTQNFFPLIHFGEN